MQQSLGVTWWNPPSGVLEMDAVTSDPALLFKKRCIFFSLSRLVCVLSQKELEVLVPFLPFLPVLYCRGPLHFACIALSDSLISPLNSTTNSAIPSWTLWTFLAGKDQQQTNRPNDQAGSFT